MASLVALSKQIVIALVNAVTDSDYTVGRRLLIVGGFTASGLRLSAGMTVGKLGPRPARTLRLWEFEACADSRAVRETLSSLDLDAELRPCPIGGTRFRTELNGEGVPRLEDPNAGITLSGAAAIVRHLHERYGVGRPPGWLNAAPTRAITGLGIRVLTGGSGAVARPSQMPAKPLELWSFEASPYCRLARAALSELELPYLLHNVAKESPRREAYIAMSGAMRVPFLLDPNTGERMFESLRIEQYLQATYGGTSAALLGSGGANASIAL
jgi:glutathione S-transferase